MKKIIEEKESQSRITSNSEEQNFLHDISIINISLSSLENNHTSIIPAEQSLKPINEFHYELKLIPHPFDFFFNSLNYSAELLKEASSLQSMPHHLRDTLFIKNDRLKQLRKKSFSDIFIIAEEIKEKANKLYNDEYYQEALSEYTKAYSFYKWIEFTDKEKASKVLNNYTELTLNPIIDSDIRKKTCRVDKETKHEEETFRFTITTLLKSLSACYIKLLCFSEAIKCLDEALEHSDDTKPDIYYRRAQARMYNKYSTKDKLILAEKDLIEAMKRKPGDDIIKNEYKTLKELMKKKEESDANSIRSIV